MYLNVKECCIFINVFWFKKSMLNGNLLRLLINLFFIFYLRRNYDRDLGKLSYSLIGIFNIIFIYY